MMSLEPVQLVGGPARPIPRRWWRCCVPTHPLRHYLGSARDKVRGTGRRGTWPTFMPTFFERRKLTAHCIPRRLFADWRQSTPADRYHLETPRSPLSTT